MLSKAILYRGTEEIPAAPIELRSGPLSMLFEPDGAFLRYLRAADAELVRGIYVAVRDRNWDTVPPIVSNIRVEPADDAFRLTFDVECKKGEIDFFWAGTIAGDPQGNVTFTMDGIARSTFLRNRIGFCVLHPIRECAGKPCVVEKVDGSLDRGDFPQFISPHQPFKDMRAISYEPVSGVSIEVRFEGDTFEMEDQRNWTDASFKTYSTPLELPLPVEVAEGTRIVQSVTVKPAVNVPGEGTETDDHVIVSTASVASSVRLPEVGLGAASHGHRLSEHELKRLEMLSPSHLRVDLNLADPGYVRVLERVAGEAEGLGVSLEVALFFSEASEEELASLIKELERVKPRISRWLVLESEEKVTVERILRMARARLSGYAPGAEFGAGTDAYFAEFNRQHPPTAEADLVFHSINPQVHAFDDAYLVETLEAQRVTVESAREIAGDLPVAITPVTLKPRFNPNATGPEPEPAPDERPSRVDPRQMSLFGAGWTLGSFKYLSEAGVRSVTYYETTGWRGVMETEDGSPLPGEFPSIPGAVFPLYHVLADVGEFSGGTVIPSESSNPLHVEGLALEKDGRTRILVANLGPKPRDVRLECPAFGDRVWVKHLDETSAEEAMRSPESFRTEPGLAQQTANGQLELHLRPYATARVDTRSITIE